MPRHFDRAMQKVVFKKTKGQQTKRNKLFLFTPNFTATYLFFCMFTWRVGFVFLGIFAFHLLLFENNHVAR
jgi:hypothetical protein